MKVIIPMAFILIVLCSCRHKYYSAAFFPRKEAEVIDSIVLDSNWDFFTRKVYKDSGSVGKNFTADAKLNNTRSLNSNKGLIEMEHLFISKKIKRVLLITLVPDVQEKYYNTTALNNKYINVYDFSTFHFGDVSDTVNTTFKFYDPSFKTVDVWDMKLENNIATIKSITEYDSINKYGLEFNDRVPVNETFKDPLNFEKVKYGNLVFKRTLRKENRKKKLAIVFYPEVANNTIYLVKENHKYRVYFKFDSDVVDNRNVLFFKNRVRRITTSYLNKPSFH